MTRLELVDELKAERFDRASEAEVRFALLVEVIRIEFLRGYGTESEPVRLVTQYRTKNGEFIAEIDPVRPSEQAAN